MMNSMVCVRRRMGMTCVLCINVVLTCAFGKHNLLVTFLLACLLIVCTAHAPV